MSVTVDEAPPVTAPLPTAAAPAEPPLTVVEPRNFWTRADLAEVWRFRELFWCLTVRDVRIRYKQTILGVAWSVVQPLATMLVFAVFIGWMGQVAQGVPNYTLFVLCGVLPWSFFSNAVTSAANSLIGNERLVTKTYFPRVILPASSVGATFFDFLVGMVLLAGWMVVVGVSVGWHLLMVPVILAGLGLTAMGFGTWLAALISAQRDFRYVLSFGIQLWMFATPCIYLPAERYPVGPAARQWLALNPAYGLITNFRSAVLGEPFDIPALAISMVVGLVILATGLIYFRRVENSLADTI